MVVGSDDTGARSSNICLSAARGSILRLWRGPSPRAYGIGIVTHWILYG